MNPTIELHAAEILPARTEALKNQGIGPGDRISPAIEALANEAFALFETVAVPRGVVREIPRAAFERVFRGEQRNEERTPVGDIYGRAEHLALFAVTIGPEVVREIDRRFKANDLALGAMLDSVASAGADRLAQIVERKFAEQLRAEGRSGPDTRVLRYSPGYCGWHISGQRALFEELRPERIGITLRDSFLMEPLKSVSGVLIAGSGDIHNFRMAYRYCENCAARGCRERIRNLLAG
jgi:hypothetical protein